MSGDLLTADGKEFKVGKTVFLIKAKDGGKTWYFTTETITEVLEGTGIKIASRPHLYYMPTWGYNGFHSTKKSAKLEVKRLNDNKDGT